MLEKKKQTSITKEQMYHLETLVDTVREKSIFI